MKKFFVSVLAVLGLFTILAPMENVQAQPIEIAPLCVVAPNPIFSITSATWLFNHPLNNTSHSIWLSVGFQFSTIRQTGTQRTEITIRHNNQNVHGWIPNGSFRQISC